MDRCPYEVRDNPDIRVGILTGEGRAFGGDIKSMLAGEGFMGKTKGEANEFRSTPLHVKK